MNIVLPKLTKYQNDVYDWLGDCKGTGRVAVIKSVRQSGKSFFCQAKLIEMSLTNKGTSAYIAPTLEQSRNMFTNIISALDGTGLIKNANASTLNITFYNNSTILFRSTQQGDANRGYTVTNILILDECAYLIDESIFTILPLVNAANAPILICSTPFVMEGYFYHMYRIGMEGKNPIVKSFDWAKEPEVARFLTEDRKAFYRETMSRQKYTTEVLGEFLTDDGLLFRGIDDAVSDKLTPYDELYIGIDFALGGDGDYTVLAAFTEHDEMAYIFKRNNLTPTQQIDWIVNTIEEIGREKNIVTILGEVNSLGKVYVDMLNKRLPMKIEDWVTTNQSKKELVTGFQVALENHRVKILPDTELLNELRRYEMEVNPTTKKITYNGHGAHDDMVIATMLAYKGRKRTTGQYAYGMARKKRQYVHPMIAKYENY